MRGLIPQQWLEGDEHELGVVGEAYLQGLFPSEMSEAVATTATERRVVMLGGLADLEGHGEADVIVFQVPWASVYGYWQGVMPLPPERWRDGPEGPVVVLVLDPDIADGQDVVIRSHLDAWVEACAAMGVPEILD